MSFISSGCFTLHQAGTSDSSEFVREAPWQFVKKNDNTRKSALFKFKIIESWSSDLEIRGSNPGPGLNFSLENLICKDDTPEQNKISQRPWAYWGMSRYNLEVSYWTCKHGTSSWHTDRKRFARNKNSRSKVERDESLDSKHKRKVQLKTTGILLC